MAWLGGGHVDTKWQCWISILPSRDAVIFKINRQRLWECRRIDVLARPVKSFSLLDRLGLRLKCYLPAREHSCSWRKTLGTGEWSQLAPNNSVCVLASTEQSLPRAKHGSTTKISPSGSATVWEILWEKRGDMEWLLVITHLQPWPIFRAEEEISLLWVWEFWDLHVPILAISSGKKIISKPPLCKQEEWGLSMVFSLSKRTNQSCLRKTSKPCVLFWREIKDPSDVDFSGTNLFYFPWGHA